MLDDAWVDDHLNWVFGLFPRTITAVDDGGNHFTTKVLDILDPFVKENLKWQLECPARLITTPAILWVAIEKCRQLCQNFVEKNFLISQTKQYVTFIRKNVLLL